MDFASATPTPSRPPPLPPARLAPGSQIADKYLVERELASGGVGVVVLATHLELGQKVAIKFLHRRNLRDPSIVERFKREARLAAQLRSEHVVRVHDIGALEDGAPFMVMEYLEGEDLGAVIHRGAVSIMDAVTWTLQACAALQEAHAMGIVHRDLKPENLFLARKSDGSSTIKVVDFGISKISTPDAKKQLRVTHDNERFGTPLYMSPEQLRSSTNVDGRSDIWSMGVVLYELLTQTLPFSGDDLPSLISNILTSTPVPLRTRRPDAPLALDEAVHACLAREAEDRLQSIKDLTARLRRVKAKLPKAPSLDGIENTIRPNASDGRIEVDYALVPVIPHIGTPPGAWKPRPSLRASAGLASASKRPPISSASPSRPGASSPKIFPLHPLSDEAIAAIDASLPPTLPPPASQPISGPAIGSARRVNVSPSQDAPASVRITPPSTPRASSEDETLAAIEDIASEGIDRPSPKRPTAVRDIAIGALAALVIAVVAFLVTSYAITRSRSARATVSQGARLVATATAFSATPLPSAADNRGTQLRPMESESPTTEEPEAHGRSRVGVRAASTRRSIHPRPSEPTATASPPPEVEGADYSEFGGRR